MKTLWLHEATGMVHWSSGIHSDPWKHKNQIETQAHYKCHIEINPKGSSIKIFFCRLFKTSALLSFFPLFFFCMLNGEFFLALFSFYNFILVAQVSQGTVKRKLTFSYKLAMLSLMGFMFSLSSKPLTAWYSLCAVVLVPWLNIFSFSSTRRNIFRGGAIFSFPVTKETSVFHLISFMFSVLNRLEIVCCRVFESTRTVLFMQWCFPRSPATGAPYGICGRCPAVKSRGGGRKFSLLSGLRDFFFIHLECNRNI